MSNELWKTNLLRGKISWYGRLGLGYEGIVEWGGSFGWGGLGAITILTGKKNHLELNAGCFLDLIK